MSPSNGNLLEAASPNVNATVSASAGTGKTWLLVARLLRLLLAGESPASILAITFTQKAAAEIRERLTASVRGWTQADDTALKAELTRIGAPLTQIQRARELYETLIYAENDIHILTFHAFCQEILERFPLEAQVPAGFEICADEWILHDEALNQLYTEAATDKFMAQALQTLFASCGGLANTNLALSNFLAHRNDWLAYTDNPQAPTQQPTQKADRQLSEVLAVNPEEAERGVVLNAQTRELLKQHAQFLQRHTSKTFLKYIATINDLLAAGTEMNFETLPQLLNCFFTQSGSVRKQGFTSNAFIQSLGTGYEDFGLGFQKLVNALTEIKEILSRRRTFCRNHAWYIAGQRLSEIYHELKLARRQLDFNDLEWLACRLLNHTKDAQWIQYRLNERIRHVLVDEFQDTNPQQWLLLKPLLEEMASQENGSSVFIVGDTKQSIYGFRRACPELQDEAARWLARNMGGKTYTIDVSQRSSPALIDFVNRVFGENDADTLRLHDFRRHDTALNTPGGVTFLPFVEKQKTQEPPQEWRAILRDRPQLGDAPAALKEGEQIAACITQLMSKRVAVHDRDGRARALRYGDITLLLRTRTRLDHYEQALAKANIPHNSGRAGKMFSSLEISDMLALLEFLANHERNLDLAQVLRSPIFCVSDEQLIALSQARGDNWFTRLGHLHDDVVLDHAHLLLSDWIDAARALPPHDLLDRVYHDGDVIRRYRLAAPDGEADLIERNLLELLDYALEFESGRYPDLAQITRHLKQRVAHATSAQATGELDNIDRVRILTVHQAKGLEAPVVILTDCGRQAKSKETYGVLADWPADNNRPTHFLLIPKSEHTDHFTEDCKQRLKARDTREATHLLYVALTRTRQYLFISGSSNRPNIGKDTDKDSNGSPSDSDWYERLRRCAPESPPQWETMPPSADDQSASGDKDAGATNFVPERAPLPQPTELEVHPSLLVGEMPGGSSSEDAKLRGEVIHFALKLLSENTEENKLRSSLLSSFPNAGEKLFEWTERARALISNEALHELFDDMRYEQVLNEVPISFIHNDKQYFGIVDRVCVGRDTIWLVDYKTHASSKQRAEQIKAHYIEQMRAYYLGVTKLWPGRAVRTSLLLTETQQLCDYSFDE